jgi:hypothetical protein
LNNGDWLSAGCMRATSRVGFPELPLVLLRYPVALARALRTSRLLCRNQQLNRQCFFSFRQVDRLTVGANRCSLEWCLCSSLKNKSHAGVVGNFVILEFRQFSQEIACLLHARRPMHSHRDLNARPLPRNERRRAEPTKPRTRGTHSDPANHWVCMRQQARSPRFSMASSLHCLPGCGRRDTASSLHTKRHRPSPAATLPAPAPPA